MTVLIAIPARYASTRYPGKPLVVLTGPDGARTLIQRSWEAAMAVKCADRVVVATDDARIRDHAMGFGAEVVMTSSAAQNGTERCAEVAALLPGYDVVVNLQGDAPLTPAWFVEDLVAGLLADPGAVLVPIAPVLSLADLAMVNLESAITERGTPVVKKYNFRAPSTALDALRAAGVDVTTAANNHGLDYGAEGLADTIAAAAEKQFPVLGIGNNATEAYTPYQAEIKGQRITVFGATDVLDGEYTEAWAASDTQGGLASAKDAHLATLVAAIQGARVVSDTVVVFLHWGIERMGCPSPRQLEVAQALTELDTPA